jgi:ribose/xylose/arabinose/galactoside ABC-type transport system permease subunit
MKSFNVEKGILTKIREEIILKYGIVIALIILFVIMSFLSEFFLSARNILNILRQISILGVLSAGTTLVIIGGGLDLSIGFATTFCGIVAAYSQALGLGVLLSVLITILAGMIVGSINSTLITYGKLPPFIATLGMMITLEGVILVWTNGIGITDISERFLFIAQGYIWKFPLPIFIFFFVCSVDSFILKRIQIGRHIFILGGQERVARLTGLNIYNIKYFLYISMGIHTGIAGILLTSRLSAGVPTAGGDLLFSAISAVVIGGTKLAGGQGTIYGTIIGVLIIGIINNGLNLLDVTSFWQMITRGLIILGAVLLDKMKESESSE